MKWIARNVGIKTRSSPKWSPPVISEGAPRKIITARSAPKDPSFFTNLAKENSKEAFKTINAALGQILTLSTALLAGTITFWKSIPLEEPYNFIVLVALIITIIICLMSAMPVSGSYEYSNASDIRDFFEKMYKIKIRKLVIAKVSLFVCIALMIIGLLGTNYHVQALIVDVISKLLQFLYKIIS